MGFIFSVSNNKRYKLLIPFLPKMTCFLSWTHREIKIPSILDAGDFYCL